jgi:hypothetical protein
MCKTPADYLLHTKNTGNCKGSSLKLQNKFWNGQVKIDTFLSGLSQTVF